MRDPVVAMYVCCGLAMAVTLGNLLRTRRLTTVVAFAVQALVISSAALAYPLWSWQLPLRPAHWGFVAATIVVVVLIPSFSRPPLVSRGADALRRRPWFANALLLMGWVLVVCGGLEILASSAVRARIVKRYTPTETLVSQQTEDWRLSHVMSDEYREPDPVLLWQPVARSPYTSQRLRGPVITREKPANTVRIFCYGDSNTDGPLEGGAWPDQLGTRLAGASSTHVEVLNAGVTGYSSYQGARRLEREAMTFHPDIVLVSFGWNDASNAIGGDDRSFASTRAFQDATPWRVAMRRALFRFDAVLVAARAVTATQAVDQAGSAVLPPRVTPEDYAANLREMSSIARRSGANMVVLTRPHLESEAGLAQSSGWRRRVPQYNAQARQVASELALPLVDAQRYFDGRHEAFADESHLTNAGHSTLAGLVEQALRNANLLPKS